MIPKKEMRQKVLDFIKKARAKGRTFGEIQRFVVEDLHGYNYDEMSTKYDWKSDSYKPARKYRGYWCTNLLGTMHRSSPGILPSTCTKINGKYVHLDYVWKQHRDY